MIEQPKSTVQESTQEKQPSKFSAFPARGRPQQQRTVDLMTKKDVKPQQPQKLLGTIHVLRKQKFAYF